MEPGFPVPVPFMVQGERMIARIYAFKSDHAVTYRTNEGIIFTINGQTHGAIPKTIFSRSSVKMGRLADSLLVIVDCTGIGVRAREDLFMNSRDRLRNSELRKALEEQLEEILKQHPGLRELREERHREEIEKRLDQSRPLEDVLRKLIKDSPGLSHLFQSGNRISNPFKHALTRGRDGQGKEGRGDKPYVGKTNPTYFKFPHIPYGEILHRNFEIGRRCRVMFETDVVNDYFERSAYPGRFNVEVLQPIGAEEPNCSLTPHNGVASLSMAIPEGIIAGEKITLQLTVEDDVKGEPFVNVMTLTAMPKAPHAGGGKTRREGVGTGGNSPGASGIALPNIHEIEENEWEKYNFNRFTACDIVQDANGDDEDDAIYTFRVNVDNVHLQTEVKAGKEDPRLTKTKFIFGNVLVGLALIQYFREKEKTRQAEEAGGDTDGHFPLPEELTVEVFVREATQALGPFILPMINQLGALSEEEVESFGLAGDDE